MKVLFMFIFNTLLDFVIIALFTCRVINSTAMAVVRMQETNIASIVYGRVLASK